MVRPKNSIPLSPYSAYLKLISSLARKKRVKIYLVGGFLRDYFLNRPCHDFDFAVSTDAIDTARNFSREIKGAFVLLDEENGCARVVKKTPEGILTFDFSDFRDKTLKGDLMHRDFTINTLAIDVFDIKDSADTTQALIDVNGALKDIKLKKVRMASKKSFKEDPLRLLRSFSLQAMLGFSIEKKTLAQIRIDKNLLKESASERIREELFKILNSERAAFNLKMMDKIGLLEKVIPQISVMYGVVQGGYHHLDVWPHSLEVVTQLEKVFLEFNGQPEIAAYLKEPFAGEHTRLALIKLAALLHDIGKPQTKKIEGERTSFHGHERVGRDITRDVAHMVKLSVQERFALEDMVFWHLRPGYLSNFKKPTERAIFRYFRDTKKEALSILLLSLADQRSTRGPLTTEADQKHHEKIVRLLIARYLEKVRTKPFVRLIDGNDLIRELKLKPGPIFAKILSKVEEGQALGKITTKQDAFGVAKNMAKVKK